MEERFVAEEEDRGAEEAGCLSSSKEMSVTEDVYTTSELKKLIEKVIREQVLLSNSDRKNGDFERCMDLMQIGQPESLNMVCRSTSLDLPTDLKPSKLDLLLRSIKPRRRMGNSIDLGPFVIEVGTGPLGEWFFDLVKTHSGRKTSFRFPLLRQVGILDGHAGFGRQRSVDIEEWKCSEPDCSLGVCGDLSHTIKEDTTTLQDLQPERTNSDKMLVSCSSLKPTCSYQHTSSSRAQLQYTWENGVLSFMFSVRDSGKVFEAHLLKSGSLDDMAFDYIYLFFSRVNGGKEHGYYSKVLDLVGKMKVSSSLTLDSSNRRLRKTEFVLFSTSECCSGDLHSTAALVKGKGFSKKIVDFIKTKQLSKRRESGDMKYLVENSSQKLSLDLPRKIDQLGTLGLLENVSLTNLETAAIVVKDRDYDNSKDVVVGGWGLKFLKEVAAERSDAHSNSSFSSESYQENSLKTNCESSKSIDVLIPAGIHGGPITGKGGPSSLVERWMSGGHCDCGGWDIGCPLRVLKHKSSNVSDASEDCKLCDIFVEGASKDESTLKMVNVNEGLYFIDFSSNLSALQSFSIGVAIIHTRYPALR
ncbi:hypothetical protein QJS10_CPA06g00088 [Acorus calamus]|uniref:Uncharacterized protein n=1 Tax=Acorus calamus TaxID=4465 RepID=A0AAV9CJY2_ACOCL|nr:hypothetical protein QJS10_CPB18g01919 [Acorus calamus]KAK1313237.1 hypothetical protein QJS10_CPA06g00088 [Acorus calamus]